MAVRWRIAILLAVITTINYIDRSVFGVVAPVVRGEFGIGDADYGLITSGFLLAYGIGQLISGPLIDRLGTKRASVLQPYSGAWRPSFMPWVADSGAFSR